MSSLSPGRRPALHEGPTSFTFDRNMPCRPQNNTRLIIHLFLSRSQYENPNRHPWSLVLPVSIVRHIRPHFDASLLSAWFFCASSHDMTISFKSCLMMSIQFFLNLHILRFIVFTSQSITCFSSLPSSIHTRMCQNHLCLLSLIISSGDIIWLILYA